MIARIHRIFADWQRRPACQAAYEKVFTLSQIDAPAKLTFDEWYQRFNGRSVILVGNSPKLLVQNLGSHIDRFDIVIRLNLTDPSKDNESFGKRTDVRFVGATMLSRHAEAVQKIGHEGLILSSQKNIDFFDDQKLTPHFYSANFPQLALAMLSNRVPELGLKDRKLRPPRSGIVALAMMMSCANAKSLTLAGFSLEIAGSTSSVRYSDNSVIDYDLERYAQNHCDPIVEIGILKTLQRLGHIRLL